MESKEDYQVYVISSRRSANVRNYPLHYTWVVREDEVQDYLNAGAINVVVGGNLMDSRNKALDHAFEQGKICVQLSDDLVSAKRLVSQTGARHKDRVFEKLEIDEAVSILVEEIQQVSAHLAGVQPTANGMNTNIKKPYKTAAFIIADFIAVKPTELRFDSRLSLKEDYDYTLQHIKKYRSVLRLENLLLDFKHYTNEGGAVQYRNEEREQENIHYLKKKWGTLIKDHPTRPNEILLNLRKR